MDIQKDVTIKSWDSTWTYHPRVRVTPESVEDIVEIIVDQVRFPTPVRPAGSMHSTARMNGDEGGTMVDMKAMNRILHFTDDTVTVEAGVTHMELAYALKDRGLQPYVTTEIGNTTMAAMACAATKDSSFPGGFGQVSSYVLGSGVAPSRLQGMPVRAGARGSVRRASRRPPCASSWDLS